MEIFILYQIIAHLLSDFILQPQNWFDSKTVHGIRSPYMWWHVLVVFFASWAFSFAFAFVIFAACISISHLIIDSLKSLIGKQYVNKNKHFYIRLLLFLSDQLLHLIVILIISIIWYKLYDVSFWGEEMPLYIPLIILAYLLCAKPTNLLIRSVLKSYSMIPGENREDLEKAGRLIVTMERVLALTFTLIGQYEAIGFIIAAKAILRFRDNETGKTEYVLIGTLLSFGIVILLGISIKIMTGVIIHI